MDGAVAEHAWALGFPADPVSIAAGADGTVWTADGEQRQIEHVDAGGNPASVALAANAPALLAEPGGALSAFDTTGPYRWRVKAGMRPLRQTLTVVEHNGTRDWVTASGLQPVAVGPAGTTWITADLVNKEGGEVAGVVVLNDAGRCIVPDLGWYTLAEARRELEQHSCRMGKVRRVNRLRLPVDDLRVGAQGVPVGKVLRHGAPVSVTLTIR
jgi:hypothetical protein